MAGTLLDIFYSFTNCLCCFPGSPQLKINNRSFRMLRLLGEVRRNQTSSRSSTLLTRISQGGFSYVYLVQDTSTSELFALKKIRCPFGQESVSQALKEVEAYALFSPVSNIIHSVDHSVQNDTGAKISGIGDTGSGTSKTVYILLPYYRRGNLQDAINANLVNHTRFPERRLMHLMLGVCKALKAMHQYKIPGKNPTTKSAISKQHATSIPQEAAAADAELARKAKSKTKHTMTASRQDVEDTDHEQNEPLIEGEVTLSQAGLSPGTPHSYAHRDIKPGNIMLSDSGTEPILMDLGSLSPSPTPITSRSLALAVQDTAAEHSTMPYRAPELFDVKTGSVIDTKVDIWSLGCTMYACLIGKSPFEARSDETGGSLSICVLGGDWRWPTDSSNPNNPTSSSSTAAGGSPSDDRKGKTPIRQGTNSSVKIDPNSNSNSSAANGSASKKPAYPSESVREIVRRCLQVEPSERPDVDELMGLLGECIRALPEDELGGGFVDGEGGEE